VTRILVAFLGLLTLSVALRHPGAKRTPDQGNQKLEQRLLGDARDQSYPSPARSAASTAND
jgi:hypothetical protein